MIICKECSEKFKLNILERETVCPQCDTTIDFSEYNRIKRVRFLFKTLYRVICFAIVLVAMSLSIWFPWPQRLFIGLLLFGIIGIAEKLLYLPMARCIIAKMYNEL